MKIKFNPTAKMQVEFEVGDVKEAFKKLGSLQEVFSFSSKCGACGGTDIKYVVRTVEDNDYYEVRCTKQGCRGKLSFGQSKDQVSLYPKKKDKEGNWIENEGWEVWKPESKG